MPAKRGTKSKFTRADHERITRMIADNYTDEQIASIFNVHRTTIGRLRHYLKDGPQPPENPLAVMVARNAERRAILHQIEAEYDANGESPEWAELWERANAL